MTPQEMMKQLRYDRRLTQAELADLLGVSQGTVSKIEGGTTKNPPYTVYVRLVELMSEPTT